MLLAKPLFMAFGNWNLLIFFVFGIVATVFIGVPIAFAFGVMTVAYIAVATRAPMTIVISRMDEGMSHLILLSIPLFIFLGLLIEMTGMARAMVNFLASLLGHVRGGLSYVLLGAMILVSGISGAKAADMAAVGPVLFPEMKKRGAKPGELVSLLAASGAMAETIPPSLVLITIGSVTGVSIAALFTGGLLPGLVLALALAAVAYWRSADDDLSMVRRATRQRDRRGTVDLDTGVDPADNHPQRGGRGRRDRDRSLDHRRRLHGDRRYPGLSPVRLAPPVPDAGRDGVADRRHPVGLRHGDRDGLGADPVRLVAPVRIRDGRRARRRDGFLPLSIVLFIVLGSVLEGIPALVLFAPLLFPIAKLVGIHEVHYAMVAILAMGIGLFAPPLGVGFYTACAIGRVAPDNAMGRSGPISVPCWLR